MNSPFFWLGISILLVAISLMALLTVAILVLQELARAARSAEKLLDTLNRELPTTLQDLRLTGKELSDLSGEVSGSVQSARNVAQQVDQGLLEAKAQAQRAQVTTRSLMAGATAAFRVLTGPNRRRRRPPTPPIPPRPARPPSQPTAQPSARPSAQSTLQKTVQPTISPIQPTEPVAQRSDRARPFRAQINPDAAEIEQPNRLPEDVEPEANSSLTSE
ncbi:MAG: hypothetical protein WA947_16315 [Phormidesmis sp.]